MIRQLTRYALTIAILIASIYPIHAQDDPGPGKDTPTTEKKVAKTFKILTSGKRVTIQSNNSENNLKRIFVWTSSGNRIVEQHQLDVPSYAFSVSATNEKIFFLLVEFQDGQHFSEKFGVR